MLVRYEFALRKVISGGQAGADQAGLVAAEAFGLETGGFAPTGFATVHGSAPELGSRYGLIEGGDYVARTWKNVRHSDATVRFASNFNSPGELCTLRAINRFSRPYLDIQLPAQVAPAADLLANFIERQAVSVLNVAGNADRAAPRGQNFERTFDIMMATLTLLDNRGLLVRRESNDTGGNHPDVRGLC